VCITQVDFNPMPTHILMPLLQPTWWICESRKWRRKCGSYCHTYRRSVSFFFTFIFYLLNLIMVTSLDHLLAKQHLGRPWHAEDGTLSNQTISVSKWLLTVSTIDKFLSFTGQSNNFALLDSITLTDFQTLNPEVRKV